MDTIGDLQQELYQQIKDLQDFEVAVKAGWVPVDKPGPKPWPREEVKAWMAEECKGKYQFGTHHSASELEADASNFVLTWL